MKRSKRDARQRRQKKRKLLFEVIENDAADDGPKTELLALNENCLEEVLEWLPLSDLVCLSTTCKRLQGVVSRYFSRKYPTKRMTVKMDARQRIEFWPREKYIQRFREYFQNIGIRGRQPALFRHVGTICNKTLKKIRILEATALTEMHGRCIEELLKNVEIVEFEECSFAADFYDSFLKYCSNLKQLVLKSFKECTHSGIKNKWLLQKYPHMKHLNWSFDEPPPDELITFFHRNPNVRSFGAARFPLEVTSLIMKAGIRLEVLCLDIGFGVDLNMKQIFQSIDTLHKQNQFKKLHMIPTTSMFVAARFPPLEYLDAIMANQVFEDVIAAMHSLKVLYLDAILFRAEAEILAQNLINLEEIYAYCDAIDAIVPFVLHSVKLKKIYVNKTFLPKHMQKINLNKLSKERAKLQNACHLVIYLKEELYINIKWTVEDLKQGLIEIKRAESHFINNTLVRM
ncbi:uncharacterized protein LOC116351894 [Contarinia nasturtii]|uniref:uncharacterized protein LOC116351894 n=1 Tax=Contarinia nasturtii TaxID=265458 RepID=UPI0012D3F542|nr:uncharacterized protein LOC116351894 [Contarinia nasturtii]